MNKFELQAQLDLKKWLDSETQHRDMCGMYDYCKYCDLNDATPCATASLALDEANAIDDVKYANKSLGKNFDYEKVMTKKANRKPLTFAEKYALSDEIVKERYAILKNAFTDTDKSELQIKSRISKQCDTYRRGGDIVGKITIIGTSLRINLPLDPDAPEYNDGKTPHVNMGHKKVYEEVPFQFKVNSKLALKRALALIEIVKAL